MSCESDRAALPRGLAPDEQAAAAHAYESAHRRVAGARLILTLALLGAYFFTGASDRLAETLRVRFGNAWPVANGAYALLTLLGLQLVLFPLDVYGGYVLERRFGLSRQRWADWCADFFKSLALELGLGLVAVETLYALMRWAPRAWWLGAAALYVVFAVALTAAAPALILPLFYRFEPLAGSELAQAAEAWARKFGLRVIGVYRWNLGAKTAAGQAVLAGLGRTRRILLSDTLLHGYRPEEILAILAHEIGHYRHRDVPKMVVAGAVLAGGAFYFAHRVLSVAAVPLGFSGPGDIGAFPLLGLAVMLAALIFRPVIQSYARRRELAADACAVRALGRAEPLASALAKLADQNLVERRPPAWVELLLHSHPSVERRIREAQKKEAEL